MQTYIHVLTFAKYWINESETYNPETIEVDLIMEASDHLRPVLSGLGVGEIWKHCQPWPYLKQGINNEKCETGNGQQQCASFAKHLTCCCDPDLDWVVKLIIIYLLCGSDICDLY